jgi:HTH-type transcriptional regulator/antitoxin HigA
MKTKTKLAYAVLPKDFAGLCRVHLPRVIHDRVEYDNTMEVIEAMVLHADQFTAEQSDYFELLSQLVTDYDATEVKWPNLKPIKRLEHLMAEQSLTPTDLSRILGASRNLGGMLLRGDRSLTLAHVTRLAHYFQVSPVLFLETGR